MRVPANLAGLVVVVCCCAGESLPVTVEDRLRQLEQEMRVLREENVSLRRELGLSGRTNVPAIKPAGTESMLAIGGVLQVQAEIGDRGDARFTTDNDRIYLRRARINASGRFMENFEFRVELDLAGTLAETTGLRAQMTDGFINWNRYEFANIRAGQFKTPFGFEQLYTDPKLYAIEQAFPTTRLTLSRQLGVQLWGDLLDKRLSYASGIFNGDNLNNSFNNSDDLLFVERISGTLWRGKLCGEETRWSAGADYFYSREASLSAQPAEFGFDSTPGTPVVDNIFAGSRQGLSFDTQFHCGPFDLWLEYLRCRFEPDSATTFDADGWYAQASYFVVPKFLQFVVKFDSFDPNRRIAGNSTDTWTLGVNYYIKGDDLKLQLNYLLVDAASEPDDQSKVLLRLQTMF